MIHVADLFCGAGGTSTGAVEALEMQGKQVHLTAINHWDVAIATHLANHPTARHLCTSLDNINPRALFKEGELDLLWASPECTHHSVARGGKPINDQSRSTAWCVTRWAEALRPNIVLVENVPEFETWGAIGTNGRPLKTKKGALFLAWVGTLEAAGYTVDWRVLCAADYGDPTTRRRLFVQAVRGRRKIVWPDPTHAAVMSTDMFGAKRKAWVPARDIIDWTLQGQSIYERKRPLSEKTLRRIMAGLEKFGLKPFITPGNGERKTQRPRTHGVSEPIPTVTAQGHLHLAEPFIICMEHQGSVRSADRPLPTVTTARGGAMAVAQPFLIPQRSNSDARSIDKPAPTVTTTSRGMGLAEPFLVKVAGSEDRPAHSTRDPLPTVTAGGVQHGLAQPFLVKLRGTNDAASVDNPSPTITASGTHLGLAEPFLVHTAHGKSRRARSTKEPLPAIAGNRGDIALIEPGLLPQHQGGILRAVSEPAPTVATDGAIALVEPFLVEYYGTGEAKSVKDPVGTVTCRDRFGLVRPIVILNGERYLLDIRFRMLQPHELAAAQGFRRDYKFTGNKSDQVKQIGNAVPRRLARAIVTAATTQNNDVSWLVDEDAKEKVA